MWKKTLLFFLLILSLFHGCDSNNSDYNGLKDNEDWIPLPLTKNLQKIVFGVDDFVSIFQTSNEIPELPVITNGYYYFKDRHSESTDSSDDTYLLSRSSFNFDVLIFDLDTHILYIFQLDT